MKYRRTGAEVSTITREIKELSKKTGNTFQSIAILVKRSEQINEEIKTELLEKINVFTTRNSELEEVFENTEQIEVSRFYERLPKPWSMAIKELMKDKIYIRDTKKEEE